MTKLLEIKDKMVRFCGSYEMYVMMAVRFVFALVLFLIINANIGYMEKISSLPVALVLALLCGVLPSSVTLLFAGLLVTMNLYYLSLEAAVVALILFLVSYLVYFRFSARESMTAVLTPIVCSAGMPQIMPVVCGLTRKPHAVISLMLSTVMYYYVDGVKQNETAFTAGASESGQMELSSKFSIAIGQITDNRELFLVLGVMLLSTLLVYFVRQMSVEHAWVIAIVSGVLLQVCALFAGYLILGISGKIVMVIVGSVVSLLVGLVLTFFCMDLDYERVEHVQFEDDDYYYYVKAVPKKAIASEEKTVKHFGTTGSIGRRINQDPTPLTKEEEDISMRVIAQELDIDEDLL